MADRMIEQSLNFRLRQMERNTATSATVLDAWQWYDFLVAPDSPPGTVVQIRPGVILPGYRYGLVQTQTYISATTCDFTVTADTGLACNFANANYYLGIVLCYRSAWLRNMTLAQPYAVAGGATEYATALAAEQAIDSLLNGDSNWLYDLFPLWAMVLRNNGVTGIDGQVLAIDAVNRGRSYLWRDARTRNLLSK